MTDALGGKGFYVEDPSDLRIALGRVADEAAFRLIRRDHDIIVGYTALHGSKRHHSI